MQAPVVPEAPARVVPIWRGKGLPLARARTSLRLGGVLLLLGFLGFLLWEVHTSTLQSRWLSSYAARLTWEVREGASPAPVRAAEGPYDIRHGYTALGGMQERLDACGFPVARQADPSPQLRDLAQRGITPPYDEKSEPALLIEDVTGQAVYDARPMRNLFREFIDIPPVVVQALLYVENRQLLDETRPHLNPALEWDRLVISGWRYVLDKMFGTGNRSGGSTLATQVQKFRHSPNGRTSGVFDKLRQMTAASVSAYRDGSNTLGPRRRVVVDYLNGLPLGAAPGTGEVAGLGEGMWVWFGKSLEQLVVDLSLPEDGDRVGRKGESFKQALALLLATRRPALYLDEAPAALERRIEFYLRELAREGIISHRLAAAARVAPLALRERAPRRHQVRFGERKAANAIRTDLLAMLGVRSLYELDHLDLRVRTTLDVAAQIEVMNTLRKLHNPTFLRDNGFLTDRLLASNDPAQVAYSFTLYESDTNGNRLLVQADNLDRALDLNEDAKLEFGSTAKLRTLATYLMIVSELRERYRGSSKAKLRRLQKAGLDPITRWSVGYLRYHPGASLERMLWASLSRGFSADPGVTFFTGGGMHSFQNFDGRFDDVITLRTAFRHSVNLVFIRLMRDMVRYYTAELGYDEASILDDQTHADRRELLDAAVERESREHLRRAYRRYGSLEANSAIRALVGEDKRALERFAIFHLGTHPEASLEELRRAARRVFPQRKVDAAMQRYYVTHARRGRGLSDQAWLMKREPLAIWFVRDRIGNPNATWSDLVERSAVARREAYDWLFRKGAWRAQRLRLRTELERRAFDRIHASWQKLGYPFDSLVPSLATAIGSSADRPTALAEFVGILQNGGLRAPVLRVQAIHFGEKTPFETHFEASPAPSERVMPEAAAEVLKQLMQDVVQNGTGRRVRGALQHTEAGRVAIGGKTGSGDNRFERFGSSGELLSSRVVNRTASFVFFLGEHHYGVVTALVPGEAARDYSFTSALALQAFKVLAPAIEPLVSNDVRQADAGPADAR
ncbi:MAG: transglycosylase domain-containing protein [Candidatus Latescibacterota bacterium]|nr:MAG: transglycosylase domain-containing protein [Candidatus Latescibacterota bacterium]